MGLVTRLSEVRCGLWERIPWTKKKKKGKGGAENGISSGLVGIRTCTEKPLLGQEVA